MATTPVLLGEQLPHRSRDDNLGRVSVVTVRHDFGDDGGYAVVELDAELIDG